MKSLRKHAGACLMAALVSVILAGPVGSLRAQDTPVPELRPRYSGPITVRMIGQTPDTLYETIAKYAGINVLWDPDAKAQSKAARFTLELSKATLRAALDRLASMTKTSWKPISENTISVALR